MTESQWLSCQNPNALIMLDYLDIDEPGPHGMRIRTKPITFSVRKLKLYRIAVCRMLVNRHGGNCDPRGDCERSIIESAETLAMSGESWTKLRRHHRPRPETVHLLRDNDRNAASDISFRAQAFMPEIYTSLAQVFRNIVGNPFHGEVFVESCQECHGSGYLRPQGWSGQTIPGDCMECQGRGQWWPSWRTPLVAELARATLENRLGECQDCLGWGVVADSIDRSRVRCQKCCGTGADGLRALDPDRMLVLSDAMEEAGCTNARILDHLRGKMLGRLRTDIGRTFMGDWVIDGLTTWFGSRQKPDDASL